MFSISFFIIWYYILLGGFKLRDEVLYLLGVTQKILDAERMANSSSMTVMKIGWRFK